MTGRTPAEAVRAFRGALQQAVSCVTADVLTVGRGGYAPAPFAHLLQLPSRPVRLAGEVRIALTVNHWYHVVHDAGARRQWRVHTAGYLYALDNWDGREIIAYHWHPIGPSHVTTPHLHLGAGAGTLRRDLAQSHLPTGPIPLMDVLRLAIEAFAVRPLRPDWSEVLERTRSALAM